MKNDSRSLVRWTWPLMLLSFVLASCSGGSQHNRVEGKVIYKDQPLSGALVTFHPKGQKDINTVPSVGMTKDDGTFTMKTGNNDGVPAGEYIVTIICSRIPEGAKKTAGTGGADTVDILQGAYANRDHSKLTVTIKDGENKLEPFNLK